MSTQSSQKSQSSMITDKAPVAFSDAIDGETDVVIIGGGIPGVATAYYGDIEPDHSDGWKDGIRAIYCILRYNLLR